MIEAINSDLVKATNSMQPKSQSKKIIVYTESYEDIGFWYSILQDFETSEYKFEVKTPSRNSNVKGKQEALSREMDILSLGVGQYMIICIDSDYDYLLQDATALSKKINESPYIFQTYVYAIENYMCHADSLHFVCSLSSNVVLNDFDFISTLKKYSNIIYELLVLSVWVDKAEKEKRPESAIENVARKIFPLKDFGQCVAFFTNEIYPENIATCLQQINDKVTTKYNDVYALIVKTYFGGEKDIFEKELEAFKSSLTDLGVTPDNAYLFMKGHCLKDGFIQHLIKGVCKRRIESRMKEIDNNGDEVSTSKKQFHNTCRDQMTVLSTNTEFKKHCLQYQKLYDRLLTYSSNLVMSN